MKTLNLPQTTFDQRANATLKEEAFNQMWNDLKVFENAKQNTGPSFVLHDGPPYANGDLHAGHVLNKMLKDVVVKYKMMRNFKVDFRPGWDCHGLPTELQVVKKFSNLNVLQLREKCEELALSWQSKQENTMRKLGLFADWSNKYVTCSKEYETKQLDLFFKLFSKNLVTRKKKPVYYSPSTRTVLADSELEYFDRKDLSAYVLFRTDRYDLMVWTTQPWTLWGNVAVCMNSKTEYVMVSLDRPCVVSKKFATDNGLLVLRKFDLSELDSYYDMFNVKRPVVFDNFVTNETGTGLVHLCPAHGEDDFRVAEKYKLSAVLLTDWAGKYCYGELSCDVMLDGNSLTVEALRTRNMLYKAEEVVHSYPHDWRTGKAVYFMLTEQFFLELPTVDKVKAALQHVTFKEEKYKNRLTAMVSTRKDWCLSRQRKWGFPLPVFLHKETKEVLFNEEVYSHLKTLFDREGANAWFKYDVAELLPKSYNAELYEKCNDTMDVWFDSGSSWHNVTGQVADLYFEGSDQHRGWFQSSLLSCLMLNDHAPYKEVLTHGFVLDQNGKKMAKSLGNVVDPFKYVKQYNTDTLRLWTMSVDYSNDALLGDTMMKNCADSYFKMRNSLRYMLSNVYDYNNEKVELSDLDKQTLLQFQEYKNQMTVEYDNYAFQNLTKLTLSFMTHLSKAYFTLENKSTLYELDANDPKRRAVQYVMHFMLTNMTLLLAPMTPYLCEEVWQHLRKDDSSVFMQRF